MLILLGGLLAIAGMIATDMYDDYEHEKAIRDMWNDDDTLLRKRWKRNGLTRDD
jgi:hypothetical protein